MSPWDVVIVWPPSLVAQEQSSLKLPGPLLPGTANGSFEGSVEVLNCDAAGGAPPKLDTPRWP